MNELDFLKIDIEGLDFAVLKSVPWETVRPKVIECEFEDARTEQLGHSHRDMADFLCDANYTVYISEWHPVLRYGVAHDWRRLTKYPTPLESPKAWGNLIAFEDDPGSEVLQAAFADCLQSRTPPPGSVRRRGKPHNRQANLARAAKMRWFHALDFGDCQSSGRFPEGTPQNITLYGVMDLLKHVDVAGKLCLDVGTAHGICAFNMASRGGKVTATDIHETVSPPFSVARDLLNLDVDYRKATSFDNILSVLGEHQYDVMVCAGVLYHLLNPFDSVLKARRLLKPEGILVLETAYDAAAGGATIDFNPVSGNLKEVYTYWVPSELAVLGMMRFVGFDVMAIRKIRQPDRIAVIAKNVPLSKVQDRTDIMVRLHETGIQDPSFPGMLPDVEAATVKYTGPRNHVALDWSVYQPDFYPHPTVPKRVLGSTTWRSTERNF